MNDIEKSCCFTGYRADKFPFPLSENDPQYNDFSRRLIGAISKLINNGVNTFYTGMANGFDIIAAEQVALIKQLNKDIKLIAVIPFKGQERGWSYEWKARYNALSKQADEVVVLNDRYEKWAFSQRNKYMVERSRYVITFFDGKSGGTKNTLEYASSICRDIVNIYKTDVSKPLTEDYRAYYKIIEPED